MQITGSLVAGSGIGKELSESLVNIKVNNLQILGLLDTGASECFMDSGLVKTLGLIIEYSPGGSRDSYRQNYWGCKMSIVISNLWLKIWDNV